MKPHILIPAMACCVAIKAAGAIKETSVAMVGIYLVVEHLIIHRRKA